MQGRHDTGVMISADEAHMLARWTLKYVLAYYKSIQWDKQGPKKTTLWRNVGCLNGRIRLISLELDITQPTFMHEQ